VGVGKIAYECKAKDMSGHEWVFVGPDAALNDRSGMQVGTYVGPPATWASLDGSKVTATQVAVAPAGAGNIPISWSRPTPPRAAAPCRASATSSAWPPAAAWRQQPCGMESIGANSGALPGRLHLLESRVKHPSTCCASG
jgi:hypothetical protein